LGVLQPASELTLHGDEHQNMSRKRGYFRFRRNLNPVFFLISHFKENTY
jgi:hypothetical protein